MQETLSPTPLVTAPSPSQPTEAAVPVRTQAGGMPTEYIPYYNGDELRRISENRVGSAGQAEYEFHGARLIRYRGAALQAKQTIELKFDLKGALIESRGSAGPIADEEIASVRSRAQLLRSHALAEQATRSHPMQ